MLTASNLAVTMLKQPVKELSFQKNLPISATLPPKTRNCIAMKPRRWSAYKPSLLLFGFFLNILKTKPSFAKWFYVIHTWILFYIFFFSFLYFDKLLVFLRNKLQKLLSINHGSAHRIILWLCKTAGEIPIKSSQ